MDMVSMLIILPLTPKQRERNALSSVLLNIYGGAKNKMGIRNASSLTQRRLFNIYWSHVILPILYGVLCMLLILYLHQPVSKYSLYVKILYV
jgi:hypothetical protein